MQAVPRWPMDTLEAPSPPDFRHDCPLHGHSAQRLLAGEHDETGIMQAVPRWPMDTLRKP
ncbi:hypothetical protein [Halomonas rhizosphaerae]|uniref:Uncharacterized protein n=1 Tax=Halomonas rhizosphaerae TaxID=3043296 RepID=A0ABT6V441_9GAMM|nr:hypothetical protein [Halomonas rhizosphaerae]MDI5892974.1 hypothetical protein [Halomonas rhizosphaerae]